MSATTATGFGLRLRATFLGPPFPFLRPLPSFAGHFMFRQRTQGGRPRMMTLMTGCPHALHGSSVGTMSPRWGRGEELSQAGYLEQHTNSHPYVPWRLSHATSPYV